MTDKSRTANTSIRKKIVTAILLVSLVMFGTLYSLFFVSMEKMLADREHDNMDSQLMLAKNVLEYPVDYLPDVTKSWASDWNNAYDYVTGKFDGFPEHYLNDYPFRLYNLDFITVLDAESHALYEKTYQHESDYPIPKDLNLSQIYTEIGKKTNASEAGIHGFVKVEDAVYYVSSQPITREDKTGGSVGALIFGRVVTHDLDYLNYDPNIVNSIHNISELPLSETQKRELQSTETLVTSNEKGDIQAYIQVKDLFGSNDSYLSLTSPRYLYDDGLLLIIFNLLAISLFCTVMVIIVLKLLGRIVVKPLGSLVDEVNSIDFESACSTLETKYKNKELNFLTDAVNNMLGRIKTHQNVIERKNKDLYYNANFDALTGLKNRVNIGNTFVEIIESARQDKTNIGVFMLDMDRFKFINDAFGHSVGDAYIVSIAQRLQKGLRKEAIIGRFSGDEFVVILTGNNEKNKVYSYADAILALFEAPFVVKDRAMHISVSIGSSVYPDDGLDGSTLLKNSEIAMYRAKDLGGNGHCRYDSELSDALQHKLYLENKIRDAVNNNFSEFQAYFQPKILSENKEIVSCEALMRWVTPEGIIGPNEFIPLAEETGLIVPLSRWMLEEACRCNRIFEEQGMDNTVSVNISAQVLLHKDFINMIKDAVGKTGSDIKKLDIEITEATLIEDLMRVSEVLSSLHEIGVTVSIDDFGTGYSSLSYLKKLPIDRIKIDRSFITNLNVDDEDKAIVNAIIAMAKSLHVLVTAEGVEDSEQFDYLKSVECEELQGYHFSRPIPYDEYIAFHKKWQQDNRQ